MLVNQNVLCMNLSISLSKDKALVSSPLVGKIIRISQMGHESNYALLTDYGIKYPERDPHKAQYLKELWFQYMELCGPVTLSLCYTCSNGYGCKCEFT